MNQIEGITSNNSNNVTVSNNINAMPKSAEVKKENKTEETAEGNQAEITAAINKLNDTMNADIDYTVSQAQKMTNTSATTEESQAGGSRRENHLTHKIRMLRLKLTKRKLEAELNGGSKHKNISQVKTFNKNQNRRTMKNKK